MSERREAVTVQRAGATLVISLNRPEARNAVDKDLSTQLEEAVDLLEADPDLHTGVLIGTGTVFCAGADLKAVRAGGLDGLLTERGGFAGFVRRARHKPVIAALNGDAVAGGMEIAIACDLIIAAQGAQMGIPEVRRSLVAVGGALANLPRLIGEKAALELAMTGALWPVERLATLGLVTRIVPAEVLLDEALALADTINRNAPLAVRATRRAIVDGRDQHEAGRWRLAEDELHSIVGSDDYLEGLASFAEKRDPLWTGH